MARLDVQANDLVNAIRQGEADGYKVIVLEGSSGSGKTIALAQVHLIWSYQDPNAVFSIVRDNLPDHKKGAIRDWGRVLTWADKKGAFSQNKTDLRWTNLQTGTALEFFAIDKEGKGRGPRRDRLWINEASGMSYDIYRQLAKRTKKTICLDYNPSMQRSWIYDEVIPRDDCLFIHSTYKDNRFLTEEEVREIEIDVPVYQWPDGRQFIDWKLEAEDDPKIVEGALLVRGDPYHWGVFGLGQRGSPEEAIYRHIATGHFPQDADDVYGLDFGSTHPMVLNRLAFVDRMGQRPDLHIDELFFATNADIADVVRTLKDEGVSKNARIWCDESRPGEIRRLQQAGYRGAAGAPKGKGSVYSGITWLKKARLVFTPRSERSKTQHQNYRWRKVAGVVMDEPVKLKDDACFPAGTMVETRHGPRPIELIQVGDLVLTRYGYKRVLGAGMTSSGEEIFAFSLPNGKTLRCTRGHPIFSLERGFIPACTLMQSDTLCILEHVESPIYMEGKTWPKLALRYMNFWESDTGAIPTRHTDTSEATICAPMGAVPMASKCYTGRFGRTTTVRYQGDITSITRTATRSIIRSPISLLFRLESICRSMLRRVNTSEAVNTSSSLRRRLKPPRSGIEAQRVASGTASMQRSYTNSVPTWNTPASNAMPHLKAVISQARAFAPTNASPLGDGPQVSTMNPGDALAVAMCSPLTNTARPEPAHLHARQNCAGRLIGRAPVYNLTVEDTPEFFAEGVLVHNCDAVRYGAYTQWGPKENTKPSATTRPVTRRSDTLTRNTRPQRLPGL